LGVAFMQPSSLFCSFTAMCQLRPLASGMLKSGRFFLSGYLRHVDLTSAEYRSARSGWPGWAHPKEASYLFDLATVDLDAFTLMD